MMHPCRRLFLRGYQILFKEKGYLTVHGPRIVAAPCEKKKIINTECEGNESRYANAAVAVKTPRGLYGKVDKKTPSQVPSPLKHGDQTGFVRHIVSWGRGC